jgi:hypothetical protein
MTTKHHQDYLTRTVPFSGDPLAALSMLVQARLHQDYIVYENEQEWSFAGGVLVEICLDSTGARMSGLEEMALPFTDTPLKQVQNLLTTVPVANWRAYGWAAFELAYAKDGDLRSIGRERLLHLVVPETEVRIRSGHAQVRSVDPAAVALVIGLLAREPTAQPTIATPVDVLGDSAPSYQRAVETAVAEIHAHKLEKVILSRIVALDREIDLVASYVSGRRANSPARSFLLNLDGVEAAGFSPEIVVHVDPDGRVVSQPLAGTRALTADPVRNQVLRTELLADPKEIYEHAISVKTACQELGVHVGQGARDRATPGVPGGGPAGRGLRRLGGLWCCVPCRHRIRSAQTAGVRQHPGERTDDPRPVQRGSSHGGSGGNHGCGTGAPSGLPAQRRYLAAGWRRHRRAVPSCTGARGNLRKTRQRSPLPGGDRDRAAGVRIQTRNRERRPDRIAASAAWPSTPVVHPRLSA